MKFKHSPGSLFMPEPGGRVNNGSLRLAWVRHGEYRIHTRVADWGPAESESFPPVILHHGMAQSGADWFDAGWCDALEGRKVIALDALGHGQSDKPHSREAYSIENRAAAVIQVADAHDVVEFDFFGFSMGGRVGFELALSYPDRVRRLVVGGMHGLRPSIDRRNLERRVAVLRSSRWRLVERAVGAHRMEDRSNDPEALALSTEAVLDWCGADERLASLSAPTLIYCGAQDSLLEYAQQTARLVPESTYVELPDTGHAASFYSSIPAREAVREFLTSNAL